MAPKRRFAAAQKCVSCRGEPDGRWTRPALPYLSHTRRRFCIPVVAIMLRFATARLDAAAVLRVSAAGRPLPTISDVAVIFCNSCDSLRKE
jgi:hypothetical protein